MGMHKTISTPDEMWGYFQDYKKWVEDNPVKKHVFVGKDGKPDYEKRERPLTLEGFYNYCEDVVCCVHQYFENREERYSDFVGICSRIRRKIRQDQIEGGMAGIYNPSITQRLNGLTEKQEVDHTTKGESISVIESLAAIANKINNNASS
jgi:hypothetical protein